MAKIILDVALNYKSATQDVEALKKQFDSVAKSLLNIKPDKELTAQIKELSNLYKALADAAKKAGEADLKAATYTAKITKAQEDAAAATAKRQKAETDAAAAVARRASAEANAVNTIEKTKAAMEKRAKAAEDEGKSLWNLEKAFASLSKRQEDIATKTNVMDDALRDVTEETEDAWREIRAFNENGEALTSTVAELREKLERLSAQTASYEKELNAQAKAELEAEKAQEKLTDSFVKAEGNLDSLRIKLNNMLTAISNVENRYPAGTFTQLKEDIIEQISAIDELKESVSSSGGNMQEFIDKEQTAEQSTKDLSGRFAELKASTDHVAPAVATLGDKFGNLIEKYAKFYASSLLVRKPLQLIQNALEDVGETLVKTEDAVIELNRVLDDPQPAQEISNRLYDMAYQYGSTFENASQIAANFARAGKSWNESLQATEAALLAMNVAELNATEASDGLLSIIAQFDMETSDLIDVVDKLNKTADKNPVSTQKLLQAIQRAGSAAKNANVSFDQTLGLITAISEATNRSGQNIGTAINSLIQYSTKNVDVFAKLSKESEDMVEKFKMGLVSIVDVWNQVSADIQSDKTLRDKIITDLGTDGLEELSSTLHDELGDLVSEIDGVYNVANTYRKNYFIALLDNMDRFMDVQKQLTDYQGYSQIENEKYMETYTAKVNQLTDAWQKLANDEQGFLGFKKGLVELGIRVVEFIEWTGGLKETLFGISTIIISILANIKAAKIGEALEKTSTSIKTLPNVLKDIGTRYDEWKAATEALTAATEAQENATLLTELAERKAAASAALWQSAMGWISIAATVIMLVVNSINKYVEAQEEAREKAIALGKETSENAKKIEELRKKQEGLDEKSVEYLDIEDQIVELLGNKKVLLEDVSKGTEEYTKRVKELTEAELAEAKYNAIVAKNAAEQNAKNDFYWSKTFHSADLINSGEKELGNLLATSGNYWTGETAIEEQYKIYERFTKRLEELKREYVLADANQDEELKKNLEKRIKAVSQFVNNTAESMGEYAQSVQYYDDLVSLSVDHVTASFDKVPSVARKTSAELQAIAEENGMTLEEVQAVYDRVGQGLAKAAEQTKEAADALDESGNAAENTGAKYDKAGEGVDNFAKLMSAQSSTLADNVKALETIQAAQEEFADKGALSIETVQKLSALGSEWVYVLFDENGAIDLTSDALEQLIDKTQEQIDKSGYLIEKTETESKAQKDLASQIDDVQSALSFLNSVQEEYNETGYLSIDTLQQLISLDSEYLDLIINEEGQIQLNKEAVDKLLESKNDLLDELLAEQVQQYAVDRANYYMAKSTEEVAEKTGVAAKGVSVLAATMRLLKGDSVEAADALVSSVDAQVEALHRMAISSGFYNEDWEELWVADVQAYTDKLVAARQSLSEQLSKSWESTSKSSSSGSSSKTEKDEILEGHKDLVSLLESELTLMEHQGASQEDQIAKIREIQSAIHDQAEYMRSIGASQEDINKLSSDWWKWQEKINKFADDNAKAAEKAAAEQKKAAEEQKRAEEEARKARIAALNAETSRHKQVISDLKAELTLWQKQGKSVSDQVKEMKEIQSALHDEAEWLRYLKATQDEIEVNQADIDALSAEWWDWQEKILKLYKETLDAQKEIELDAQKKLIDALIKDFDDIEASRKEELEINERILAVENARKDVADAIRNAQLDYVKSTLSGYIKSLSDAKTLEEKQNAVIEARKKLVQAEQDARAKAIIDAFKAEKNVKSDALSLEEKRLAVEKARQALIDAENNRTTRVYNESSGQWEYQANAKNVQSAQESLKNAVDALNAYVEEQAWNEVADAVEKGSVSEADVLEILQKWARESYGEGSPEFVAKIQAAFRKAMGTPASPESLSGQVSAVDTAVQNLNDYLKQEAVKELEQYIAAGNTDSAGMKAILNKWLAMGEGGELYEWRDGLLDTLESAIHSGWYDDTKVTSYIEKVETSVNSLQDYLRSRFIAEMKDLVQNGTAEQMREAMDRWGDVFTSIGDQLGLNLRLSDEDRTWGSNLTNEKSKYEDIESFWEIAGKANPSDEDKKRIVERMQENSRQWWMTTDKAEQQRLADLNYVLGTSMGWTRGKDGAWYDEKGYRVYDKGGIVWNSGRGKTSGRQASGGVLRGVGGIKATDQPEIILDPELTQKILAPTSEKQFRAFAETMHLMFEHGDRRRSSEPIMRSVSSSDSHNTTYTVNGIPIPESSAERYTVAELFRMLPMARS